MRRWGIEREKKEKLSRTGSKSWRGRQTRCNLIETFIRSPSYIKHRPLKMRWRDNLIWAGLIDRPIPKDARGKEAWRERKNGETKRGVEEREWKFSLPRTSFSFSLVERRGKGREKSGREAFSRKRETIVFHMKRAHNATIFVREAEPAAPLSLRIVFPLSVFLFSPFNGISRMGAIKMLRLLVYRKTPYVPGEKLRLRSEKAKSQPIQRVNSIGISPGGRGKRRGGECTLEGGKNWRRRFDGSFNS